MNKTVRFPNERIQKKDRTLEKKHVLSRSVDGTIKRLNELHRSERAEKIIFSTEARVLRHKLKENLVQLMFIEPEEYGQKAEELIWAKVFYAVIVKVRHLTRHGERLPEAQEKFYRNHLLQGIGFYQDLSLRLQNKYHMRVSRSIDFARPPPSFGDKQNRGTLGPNLYFGYGLLDSSTDPYDEEDVNEQRQQRLRTWANEAIHRCLAYMGDLSRYQHDYFRDNISGLCIAARYYYQALLVCPEAGLPYNQLAALDATSGQFYMLVAVYDYWRCLCAKKPFEGARQNLNLLLDRNLKRYQDMVEKENNMLSASGGNASGMLPNVGATAPTPSRQPSEEQARIKDVKKLILKILMLVQRFSKAKLEQMEILRLAQDVIAELEMCMFTVEGQSCRISNPDQVMTGMLVVHDMMRPKYVPDSLVFRCVVIFISVWHHLSTPGSTYAARVVQAFIMTLFSTVLNQAVSRLQHGLKQALGLDEPAFALPSPGSSDEDNQSLDAAPQKKGDSKEGHERGDRGIVPRRRRRLRRNLCDDDALGSEDEAEEEENLSEDEFEQAANSDDNYSSDGRNSFLVEESEEDDEDDDDTFILDITAPTPQEHRGGLVAPSCGYGDLQVVPEEVNSNGGVSSSGASQETPESWSTEAVRALEELKKRLMLETGNHASERFLPFISTTSGQDGPMSMRLGAPAVLAQLPPATMPATESPEDGAEENSDDAFCREMSMKVANFSIETDNDMPPDDEEAPAGCFVETWPEECAADLLLQQQMEEEASRGELLARRFTVIGNTDLVSCSVLMDAYIQGTDLLENGAEALPDALLGHFATLLNMLNHVDEAVQKGVIKLKPAIAAQLTKKDEEEASKSCVALPEDHQMRGFVPLDKAQENLNFTVRPNTVEEEALLRADRLLSLGHRLADSAKVDFTYDKNQGCFLGPSSLRPVGMSAVMSALQTGAPQQQEQESSVNGISQSGPVGQRRFAASEARRNQLMRDMAQLRLKSEIQRLEASVESGQGGVDGGDVGLLPPYLVPHTQVLCTHLGAIQRLMGARRFILVVPEAVVDHLDVLKKQDSHAREVIRFLESESHHGNRYLRLQRHGEQIGSGPDSMPRKPWNRVRGPAADTLRWRSMLSCARYFARQAGPSTSTRGLVALLWTNNEGSGLHEIQDDAINEGILIEYFPAFYTKWKQSREKG